MRFLPTESFSSYLHNHLSSIATVLVIEVKSILVYHRDRDRYLIIIIIHYVYKSQIDLIYRIHRIIINDSSDNSNGRFHASHIAAQHTLEYTS